MEEGAMQTARIRWALLLAGLGAIAFAAPARADTADPDAARIAAAGHALKWNWTQQGSSNRYGHAETLIHAPLATVRRLVLDFGHYNELAPSITTSRVVGHDPDGSTDVYLRMGVLNNMLALWNVTRFAPLHRAADGAEIVDGQMVPGKGNIDSSALIWTMRAVGADWTVLKFDLLLRPGMPAPQSLIDEQLRDSAMDAVNSIHDRAQGSKEILPFAS
jgi:hypothetical protein